MKIKAKGMGGGGMKRKEKAEMRLRVSQMIVQLGREGCRGRCLRAA